MQDNPTPEQRAFRILQGFHAELHDANPTWLYANIKMEIQDAIAKTAVPKSDKKPRHAVGVSVLLVENGRLLLGRRKGNTAAGMLSTPGGRLELEEQPLYCAVREFYEETGARIHSDNLKVIDVKKLSRFNDHYIMFYVLASEHEGTIQNTEPDKCEGWHWHTGYELTGRADITEPVDILQTLPLIYTPSVTDQAKIDGWNDAVDMLEVTGHLAPEDAKMFRKP
jgi:8-oxo-dGTP diphosphatase